MRLNLAKRRWLLGAAAVLTVLTVVASPLAALPRNDYTLVLDRRVGPYHYLAAFSQKGRSAYADALAAFGVPSRFKANGNLCRVTWRSAGITVGFASRLRPCATGSLFEAAWYGQTLFGRSWHTAKGVHIGQTINEVRRIHPNARFERRGSQAWLVLSRRRVDEFNFITLAVSLNRAGRVATIEVPAAYIY